jgi:hypothetical protein
MKEFLTVKKMKKSLGYPVLIAVAASLLSAQTSTSGNTPTVAETVTALVAHLTKLLTLTTAQAATATTIFTTEYTALATIDSNLTTARATLLTAVEANSTTIAADAATIGTLVGQQEQAEATAQAAFYVQLTLAQQTQYKEILASGLVSASNNYPGGGPHHN